MFTKNKKNAALAEIFESEYEILKNVRIEFNFFSINNYRLLTLYFI